MDGTKNEYLTKSKTFGRILFMLIFFDEKKNEPWTKPSMRTVVSFHDLFFTSRRVPETGEELLTVWREGRGETEEVEAL